jgi:N-acetyltransferase
MEAPTFVLRGIEVELRPLELADAAGLAAAASESRNAYGYSPVPDGPLEAERYVRRALSMRSAGLRIPFAIRWQGQVVGTTSYSDFQPWEWGAGNARQRSDRPDALEIGYTWLAASAQRTRCNTEAKYLLLAYAFDAWNVYRVTFRTDERNERSRAAIQRLGARFEGIRRADIPGRDGTVRNSAMFSS